MELTRRTVLVSFVVIGLAAAAAGAGTMALFSDTESSSGNTVQAGTLDLTPNSASEGALMEATNLAPEDTASGSFEVTNSGSIDGSLDISASYSNNDKAEQPDEFNDTVSADTYAEHVNVTELTFDNGSATTDLLSNINDNDGDGKDLAEVTNQLGDTNIPLNDGDTGTLEVTVELQDVSNEYQADGIDLTFTFELNQQDGQ